MVSNRKKLKNIWIVRGTLDDRAYIKILKEVVATTKKKEPFIVVLYSH
jgi:hypothetical protein